MKVLCVLRVGGDLRLVRGAEGVGLLGEARPSAPLSACRLLVSRRKELPGGAQ